MHTEEEMQSLFNSSPPQIPTIPLHNDDFIKQMLSNFTSSSSWSLDLDPNNNSNPTNKPLWDDETPLSNADNLLTFPYDQHTNNLASKFRNQQINDMLLMPRPTDSSALLHIPADFDSSQNHVVNNSTLLQAGGDGSVQPLFNGFTGTLQSHHFQHPQGQSMEGGSVSATNQAPAQPRQKVRARRGQATDPHSIAERLRRERIAERMKALQELVPNANKTDKASMLDEIIEYVKFLQVQVQVFSMSRLGGAAAVAPLVAADMSSSGNNDCVQTNGKGKGKGMKPKTASSSNESIKMTEQQVAKLMEEDMASAMQYLQGKGLCLMPISLATAISTATCHNRNSMINNPVVPSNGDAPSSPGMSVNSIVKDANSASKS